MTNFSPREIVSELDRYIVGQNDAKRAVSIALRNRWRRQQLEGDLRDEVLPKNILMIGPTGVGKTEISRRLAKLAGAPARGAMPDIRASSFWATCAPAGWPVIRETVAPPISSAVESP